MLGEHLAIGDPRTLTRVDMLTRGMMARGADAWTAQPARAEPARRPAHGAGERHRVWPDLHAERAASFSLLIPLLLLVRQTKGAGGAQHVME